jgi:hypothetical protein
MSNQNKTIPKNSTRRRGQRRRNRRPRTQMNSGYRLTIPNSNNQLSIADSMIVDLPFTDTTLLFLPTSSSFGTFRFRGNSPFDPDPLLGGESALYYTQYASLYRRYRVLSVRVECVFVNNENFPVYVTFAPTDTDFASSISSVPRVLDLGEMSYAIRPILLGANGSQNRTRFTRTVNWPKFIGNKQSWKYDDLFASLNNTNPTSQTDLTFALCASQNFSAGVTKYIRIIYHTLWTDRNFDFGSLRIRHNPPPLHLSDDDTPAEDKNDLLT